MAAVNVARPDVIALLGDYLTHRWIRRRGLHPGSGGDPEPERVVAAAESIAGLEAPMGVYFVLGNHDYWEGSSLMRAELTRRGYRDLNNAGTWLERGGARLRL